MSSNALLLLITAWSFKLINNDNIVYNLTAQSLKERIVAIFENNFRKQLVDIKTDAGFVNVYGFVSNPQNATKNNFKQFFFVNNRFFKSAYFNKAVQLAYDKLIPEGKSLIILFFLKLTHAY
jgi:DNA mismatch repair protein MutL